MQNLPGVSPAGEVLEWSDGQFRPGQVTRGSLSYSTTFKVMPPMPPSISNVMVASDSL